MKHKLYILSFLILIILLFRNDQFFVVNFLALVICLLILTINCFNLTKFTSIVVIGHIVQFPIASFLANSQEVYSESIMSKEEFGQTSGSIGSMALAMFAFLLGMLAFRVVNKKPIVDTPVLMLGDKYNWNLICLSFVFYIVYIFFSIATNTYFHSSAGEFDVNNSTNFGFIGYLYYFGLVSIIASFYNYLLTESKKNLFIFICLTIFFEILIVPSGQRRFIILPIFIIGILFFTHKKVSMFKVIISAFILPILILLLPILEYIRTDFNGLSFSDLISNIQFFSDKIVDPISGASPAIALFIRRISDYPSVGYIYDYVSSGRIKYYGFSDLVQAPLYILPTFLRPQIDLSFAYDAQIMQKIAFRGEINGSSPMMLIGDFLIRGGLISVFLGFFILGIILDYLSYLINPTRGQISFLIWIFLLDYFSMLHTMTILKVFTLLTRHLLFFYIFSKFLVIISKINFKIKIIKNESN